MHSNNYEVQAIQSSLQLTIDKVEIEGWDINELSQRIVYLLHTFGYRLTTDTELSFDD